MARADRSTTRALAETRRLEESAPGSHVFQVLRRLEAMYRDRPRLGESMRAADDAIRIGQSPSLAFPPSSVEGFKPGGYAGKDRLEILAFGLFGPNGPLPLHLTEHARQRMRARDRAFLEFANMFHHRLASLFYRAWAAAQPTVSFDRPDEDRFGLYVGALAGFALPTLRDRTTLPDSVRLHHSGHLSNQAKPPAALAAVLESYFEVPCRVEEFVGHWVVLPESARCRLGETPETGCLGTTLTVGSRIWQCQDRFRIVFGPLGDDDYARLMPGSESVDRLVDLVRSYVGDALQWDVRLILRRDQVHSVQLGGGSQLGFNTWLSSRPMARDPEDFVMQPQRTALRAGSATGD